MTAGVGSVLDRAAATVRGARLPSSGGAVHGNMNRDDRDPEERL
ncbi:hypothetical protein ABQE69_04510 [Mycolicibacillus trivialis]|nr:hypothetical protein [Mycolicibacillus trivialis]